MRTARLRVDMAPSVEPPRCLASPALVEAGGSAREPNVEAGGSAREPNVEAGGSAREPNEEVWFCASSAAGAMLGKALCRLVWRSSKVEAGHGRAAGVGAAFDSRASGGLDCA